MRRLLNLIRFRSGREQDLDRELRYHLDRRISDLRESGLDEIEARRQAAIEFGGVTQIREAVRDATGLPAIEVAVKDIRYALRLIARSPGLTCVAIISLALGIGANTAVFTVIDSVMWRQLPVHSPDELVAIGDASRPTALREGGPMMNILSYPLYRRLRDQNHVFTGLLASGAAGQTDMSVDGGAPEPVRCRLVSGNYFEVLGVTPVLGRAFSPNDDQSPGTSPVVVISYDYWTNRFGRDPSALRTVIRINGYPLTIIGIAPHGFTGEVVGSPADVWIPLSMQAQVNPGYGRLDRRDSNWLLCLGRLKPGLSIASARAEMTVLVQQALIDYDAASPQTIREIRSQTLDVEPGARGFSWIRGHDSRLLFLLMAIVCLVLLIACADIATLLIARGASRQKEISVRLALGASRARLIRQLLTESAALAAISGCAGLLAAQWGALILCRLVSNASGANSLPFDVDLHPDMTVLAFAAVVTVLTALFCGLVPSLRLTGRDMANSLKENARGLTQSSWRTGKLLVVSQLALSVVLLVTAGLFIRSILHLRTLDVGYSRRSLISMGADLAGSGYAPTDRVRVAGALASRLRSIPGVAAVTFSENGIFTGIDSTTNSLHVEGSVPQRKGDSECHVDQVGPQYFRTLEVPVIEGRDFDEHDRVGTRPIVIINDKMAKFFFGDSSPLGKALINGGDRYIVVGVVKDMKERDLKADTARRVYLPLLQSTDSIGTFYFEIRTFGDTPLAVDAVRRSVRFLDPNLRVSSLEPVSLLIDQSIGGDRMIAAIAGFFAAVVLLLAANGLYGLISYITSRRRNEICLRMALGASRGDVIGMVVSETLTLVLFGLTAGIPAALAAARLIAATLYGVNAADTPTLTIVSFTMLMVAVLAAAIPAARASRIDPAAALRAE